MFFRERPVAQGLPSAPELNLLSILKGNCMNTRLCMIAVFSIVLLFRSTANSQWKGEFDRTDEAIAKGEDLVLQFSQGPHHLPKRWAAVVVYSSQTTPDDPDFRITTGYSYHAEDKKSGVRVSSARHVFKQPQANGEAGLGSFPQEWNAWRKGNEYLITEFKEWKKYEESNKARQFFIHPYCAPFLDPTNLEVDRSDTYIEQLFFATRYSSLGLREDKKHAVSIWGPRQPSEKARGSVVLRFDNESNRPTEIFFAFHPKWDPLKFASMPFQITSRRSIKWKKFEFGEQAEGDSENKDKGKDLEQWLPVEVELNLTSIEGRSEELNSKVFWKFYDDVPDSAFLNPLKHPFLMVQFDGSEVAKIDKDAN